MEETCLDTPESIRNDNKPFSNDIKYAQKETTEIKDKGDMKQLSSLLPLPLPLELEPWKMKLNTFNRLSWKMKKFVVSGTLWYLRRRSHYVNLFVMNKASHLLWYHHHHFGQHLRVATSGHHRGHGGQRHFTASFIPSACFLVIVGLPMVERFVLGEQLIRAQMESKHNRKS